jgi:type II secretory pathway pseudopilin PulG
MRQRANDRRAGFTLVEVLLSASLLGGLLLVAGLATDRAMQLFRQRSASEELNSSAGRLMQNLVSELTFTRLSSFAPVPSAPLGSSTLTFRSCRGVSGGAVQWSNPITLRWELETGEADDGMDNNGNGLIDEGMLVRIENLGLPGEQRVVLAHGLSEFQPGESLDGVDEDGDGLIDEAGLSFVLQGEVLTIQLCLTGTGPGGNVLTKVVETAVWIRN